jgi:hypothetical protein
MREQRVFLGFPALTASSTLQQRWQQHQAGMAVRGAAWVRSSVLQCAVGPDTAFETISVVLHVAWICCVTL